MVSKSLIYVAGDTPVHKCGALAKLFALLGFTLAAFLVHSWWGMAALAALTLAACAVAKIPGSVMNRMLAPVYVLAGFSVLFNVLANPSLDGVAQGLFFGVRMIMVVAASFIVCLTTTSSELLGAFRTLVSPLRILHAPVDDMALTLSLSVRLIPVIEREFSLIRSAQISRGAESAGSFKRKLELWGAAFAALFVGLFRHADALALAMDARCYGAVPNRTCLPPKITTPEVLDSE